MFLSLGKQSAFRASRNSSISDTKMDLVQFQMCHSIAENTLVQLPNNGLGIDHIIESYRDGVDLGAIQRQCVEVPGFDQLRKKKSHG